MLHLNRGVTFSYHLSINKERRPQQYRPSGLVNNPDKINTRILARTALEHSINLTKGLRLQILCRIAMDVLWKNARAFCEFYLPAFLSKTICIKNLHLVRQKFKKAVVYLALNTGKISLVGRRLF